MTAPVLRVEQFAYNPAYARAYGRWGDQALVTDEPLTSQDVATGDSITIEDLAAGQATMFRLTAVGGDVAIQWTRDNVEPLAGGRAIWRSGSPCTIACVAAV